jgi:hypothetical protein
MLSAQDFAGGTGESNDPYRIETVDQLLSIGSDPNLLNKFYVLANNLDLDPNLPGGQSYVHALIAPAVDDHPQFHGRTFIGCFDGKGHTIKHLTVRAEAAHHFGLFGKIGSEGRVANLGLAHASIGADRLYRTGVLAGSNDGSITCCFSKGSITARGGAQVGGLVGANSGSTAYCFADCEVTFGGNGSVAGGLVGVNWRKGTISYCYADGTVTGHGYIGGLAGWNQKGVIRQCYATGDVYGRDRGVGGFVGANWDVISNCFVIGHVTSPEDQEDIGAFAGQSSQSRSLGLRVVNCFWNTETSGMPTGDHGTGISNTEMKDINTYLTARWDFTRERANGTADIWHMPEQGYPRLAAFCDSWQYHELKGGGTPDDPYHVCTPVDLGALNYHEHWAHYRLMADIDLSGMTWSVAPIMDFGGHLDGNGHVVSNATIRGSEYLGLFGTIGRNACVEDLRISNINLQVLNFPVQFIGIFAGRNLGTIRNCSGSGRIDSSAYSHLSDPGFIGHNDGTISE